jgi:PAS domain S-box-containing protein
MENLPQNRGSPGEENRVGRTGVALNRQQTELRALFDLVPAGILLKDTENNILRVNERMAESVGKPVEEIEGRSILEIFPRDAARFYAGDLEVIRSGKPRLGVVEAVRDRDDNERWIQTDEVPVCGEDGKVKGFVVMVQDITERRRVEQELKAAELAAVAREGAQRYSFLADAVPVMIWTARPDGGLDYYNKAWFDYTGQTPAQAKDWGWGSVLHPDDLQPCVDRWKHSLATGEDYDCEYRFRRGADGIYRWFLGLASARRNEAGEIVQWVGTSTDIDDQKRAHSELEMRVADRTSELARTNAALQEENAGRKRAAAELLESKRFLQSTLDALSSSVAILDEHGAIIEVNDSWKRFAGENDFPGGRYGLGDNYLAVCDSAVGRSSAEALAVGTGIRAVMSGESDEFHLEYPCHSPREERWFIVRATRFAGDGPVRVVVAHENISARKRAEEALRASQQITEGIINAIPVRVFWKDKNLAYLGCNAVFARDAGFADLKDIIGKVDSQLGWRDQAESYTANDRKVIESGISKFNVEEPQTTPEGKTITLLTSKIPLRNSKGEISGVLGTYMDITERKRAEEALRESDERFSGAFEHAPIGVAIVSPDGRWLKVNRALCDLVGYSEAELLARSFQEITAPEDLESSREKMRQLIAGETRSFQIEKRYIHARGHLVTALTSVSLVFDRQGQPSYFIAQVQDITSRKLAETELAKTHEQLLDASRQAGMAEVATGVLHNVGNVLNSVNVSATLVANRVHNTKAANIAKIAALFDEHKGDLAGFLTGDSRGKTIPAYLGILAESLAAEQKTVLTELDELRKNVDYIKDIVAMQQTYATTSGIIEAVPVADMVEDALRINAGSLALQVIETIRDDQARLVVTTDKHKVIQILVNLVTNAVHACGESGRTGRQITVRTTSDGRSAKIAIIDNGVGIPPENLTQIFNYGFTTRKQGHGFGLHTSALAAKQLGGSLTAQSAGTGCGATFALELPYKINPQANENSAI